MTRGEEKRLLRALYGLCEEVHENNVMLHQICEVINFHHARHHRENEEDFQRNVLANLLSGMVDIRRTGSR